MFHKKRVYIFFAALFYTVDGYAADDRTLELANNLVQKVVDDIKGDISSGKVAHPNDLVMFAEVFGNTFANPIKTSTIYSVTAEQHSYTYVLTGNWLAYGPPKDNNPADQPEGTMSEMWIRDAAAQLHAYVGILKDPKYCGSSYTDECAALNSVIEGLIRRCAVLLILHPTKHAFNKDDTAADVGLEFELDSPYFFLWLALDFWNVQKNPNKDQFAAYFLPAVNAILDMSIEGQTTPILNKTPDVRPQDSKGYWTSFKNTGMISGETRASDDDQVFPFHIPNNMLASAELEKLENFLKKNHPKETTLLQKAHQLKQAIQTAIKKYGSTDIMFDDGTRSTIYAYETDGNLNLSFISDGETTVYPIPAPSLREKAIGEILNSLYAEVTVSKKLLKPKIDYTLDIQFSGTKIISSKINFIKPLAKGATVTVRGYFLLMDDANLPSLLSIPYLGFATNTNKTYINTRKYILSHQNPYYSVSQDSKFKGIGSPHTSSNIHDGIWPMALIAQGMTSQDKNEQNALINMLLDSAVESGPASYGYGSKPYPDPNFPAKGFMHESFNANNTQNFSRGWFAWPNAMFGEWIYGLDKPPSKKKK